MHYKKKKLGYRESRTELSRELKEVSKIVMALACFYNLSSGRRNFLREKFHNLLFFQIILWNVNVIIRAFQKVIDEKLVIYNFLAYSKVIHKTKSSLVQEAKFEMNVISEAWNQYFVIHIL